MGEEKKKHILMHSVDVQSLSVDSRVRQCVVIIKTFNLKLLRIECLQLDICTKQEFKVGFSVGCICDERWREN